MDSLKALGGEGASRGMAPTWPPCRRLGRAFASGTGPALQERTERDPGLSGWLVELLGCGPP